MKPRTLLPLLLLAAACGGKQPAAKASAPDAAAADVPALPPGRHASRSRAGPSGIG